MSTANRNRWRAWRVKSSTLIALRWCATLSAFVAGLALAGEVPVDGGGDGTTPALGRKARVDYLSWLSHGPQGPVGRRGLYARFLSFSRSGVLPGHLVESRGGTSIYWLVAQREEGERQDFGIDLASISHVDDIRFRFGTRRVIQVRAYDSSEVWLRGHADNPLLSLIATGARVPSR